MTEQRVQRRLAAILAVDVVGYSALMQRAEEATYAELERLKRELIEPSLSRNEGRLIKTTGDGALAEFASPLAATRCAVEIQDHLAAGSSPFQLRVGLNLGDVIVGQDGDLYGDGINIAVRLEGIADPGGILISEKVYSEVNGKLDVGFEDLGKQQLKNISKPVRAYAVCAGAHRAPKGIRFIGEVREPGGSPEPPPASPALSPPGRPSIAVLPFQNMSEDPAQEYFADGTVEDIITGLARIKALFVIARNSTFVYKGRAVDVKQVGRDLGVRYVLEGGIRKAGSRVRLTVQLVEAESGVHLWAERYDRLLGDIFALQDEITISVVGAIEPNVRKAEIERVKRRRPDNLDAYDLLLRALPLVHTHTAADAAIALPLLHKALEFDPAYASAHSLMAWCYHFRFSRGGLRAEDRAAAIEHAHAAIAYGSDDATSLAIAGFVISLDEHDHTTALDLFERALALSGSNVFALSCSALILSWMGKSDLAIDRAQWALRLSPFDSLNFLSYNAIAIARFHERKFQESYDAARHSVQSNPRFSVCHAFLAAALARLGRDEEARVHARRVLDLDPTFTIRRFAVTVDIAPDVFGPLADAWQSAGLPAS